jgi:hypothetical protein
MNEQFSHRLPVFKKVFALLLILDLVGLIEVGIALFPNFRMQAEYGQIMLVISGVMTAVAVAVLLFEILAKVFLIRNSAQTSIGKRHVAFAKALVVFNLFAVIINLLAMGGEGATLINQARMAAQVLASAAEMVAAFTYVRTVKKLLTAK